MLQILAGLCYQPPSAATPLLRLDGRQPLSSLRDTSPRRRTPPLRQTSSATSPEAGEPTPKGKARKVLLRNRLLKIFIFYFLDKTAYIIKAVNKQNKLAFPCGESGICERSEQMTREVFHRRGEVSRSDERGHKRK